MKIFKESLSGVGRSIKQKAGNYSGSGAGPAANDVDQKLIHAPIARGGSNGNIFEALIHRFVIGLKIIIPLGITLFVLFWVLGKIDNILQPLFGYFMDRRIPGLGLVSAVVLVLVVSIIMSTRPGRWLVHLFERLILHIPLLRSIFNVVKQIIESFTMQAEGAGFLYVVFIEFPKQGMKTVGLVTNKFTSDSGEELLNVFIPTAPNPTNGFLEIVKEKDVKRTKMSIDDALKMVMLGGKIASADKRSSFDHNTM